MLAQNFKTPADLDIREDEFSALVTVLGMLERGELQFGISGEGERFCMSAVFFRTKCGTVGCIGGYVARILDDADPEEYAYCGRSNALSSLYFPRYEGGRLRDDLSDITTAQAAQALRSFLTSGEPRWAEALAS